jgi:hypothetical protein
MVMQCRRLIWFYSESQDSLNLLINKKLIKKNHSSHTIYIYIYKKTSLFLADTRVK